MSDDDSGAAACVWGSPEWAARVAAEMMSIDPSPDLDELLEADTPEPEQEPEPEPEPELKPGDGFGNVTISTREFHREERASAAAAATSSAPATGVAMAVAAAPTGPCVMLCGVRHRINLVFRLPSVARTVPLPCGPV